MLSFKKLRRSIERMPRCAYIFLKHLLALTAAMLWASLLLFLTAEPGMLSRLHLAYLLLEHPPGLLLLGLIALVYLLDREC